MWGDPAINGRVAIIARTKAEAERARRSLRIAPGDGRCAGTAGNPSTLQGYYPDAVVRVVGWEMGRYATEADGQIARMHIIKRKRPIAQFAYDPETGRLVGLPGLDDGDDEPETP